MSNPSTPLRRQHSVFPTIMAVIMAIVGIALIVGGVWLLTLGGSWYYAIAGLAFLLTAYLLSQRHLAALWVYALIVAGTLIWAVWETGFQWWPLAPPGDVIFVLGALMLLPWTTRALGAGRAAGEGRGRLALAGSLVAALIVAAVSWFNNDFAVKGTTPGSRIQAPADAGSVPPGEWHAYGRTSFGQRYSPLTQLTRQNVSGLQHAWTYNTGDLRGQEGDPQETTYEVTPLKIGELLFLCTPHQDVIALNPTTGAEVWRYDPKIRNQLALQHLTCRGLAYHPGSGSPAPATTPAPKTAGGPVPDLPVAAAGAQKTAVCDAKLFMPTADGRLIAINPADGAVCSNFGDGTGQINLWPNMPNVQPGAYYSTSPPVVTRNLIVIGGTVLDNVSTKEQSGVIRAYDVNSGALVWNWDSGNPDVNDAPPAGPDLYRELPECLVRSQRR